MASRWEGSARAAVAAYRFGGFRLDLVREHLEGPAGTRTLRRKSFATLRLLAEAAPALVPLDDLLDEVWGRHAISPSAVPNVIVELRQALGDDARAPRFIETRHRRGYLFLADVEREALQATQTVVPLRRDDALLAALEACAALQGAPPQARLRRLHQLATEGGLALLALEARHALQAIARAEPRRLPQALRA